MNKLVTIGIAALLGSPACAASAFDGTWKGDPSSVQLPKKPEMLMLKDGTFTCSTCVPRITVPADGAPHAVAGSPYYDAVAVTVVDARTIRQVSLRGGKRVATSMITVSPDGQRETYSFENVGAANGVATSGKGMAKRVGPAPAGAHAVSGAWLEVNQGAQISDSAAKFTFATAGDKLRFTSPTGQSYEATIGGPAAPVTGDPGWNGVTLKRAGPDTLVETDLRNGKPTDVLTMTVTGRAMKLVHEDKLHGTTTTVMAYRQ